MPAFDLGYPAHDYKSPKPGYRGTSLQAFFHAFPNEETCFEYVSRKRFGDDPVCRRCGERGRWQKHPIAKHYYHPCGGIVSPMVRTVFDRTRIPLQLWFYAFLHFANSAESIPVSFLARQLGISEPSAFRMGSRIRGHLAGLDHELQLGGSDEPVLVRIETVRRVVNTCRNSANRGRIIVFADSERVHSTVLCKPSRSDLLSIVKRRVIDGSQILTDCHVTYRALAAYGSTFPLAEFRPTYFLDNPYRKDVIHGFLSYFWNSFGDQFRGVMRINLWRYLKEYEFRYNRRHHSQMIFWDMIARFPDLESTDIERLRLANSYIRSVPGEP